MPSIVTVVRSGGAATQYPDGNPQHCMEDISRDGEPPAYTDVRLRTAIDGLQGPRVDQFCPDDIVVQIEPSQPKNASSPRQATGRRDWKPQIGNISGIHERQRS
ncbi:hypothetical protein FHL15_006693 [Xylaria flabelliformis]|uniref:Uncharacterized protein n=1 Tax=Xylaria flabelliformis TaxID=2512241 RepID=A0A553HX45_9PEZI|nr:hypothetical protein FHL15_006693 [Xylaria flabelliformis]